MAAQWYRIRRVPFDHGWSAPGPGRHRRTARFHRGADATADLGASEPDLTHWAFPHFLLDGHHKLQAAAEVGVPIRVLSLLPVDHSLATRDQVLELPALLASA